MPSITNTEQQVCTRDDLRVVVIANAEVDNLGQPIQDEHMLRTAGIEDTEMPYFCVGPCDQDFVTWEEAQAHLAAQEAA